MRLRLLTALAILFEGITPGFSAAGGDDRLLFDRWIAGETVSIQSVQQYGIDNCFTAQPIDDSLFRRIDGLSYGSNCTVALSDLRYIKVLHYDAEQNIRLGEMICHRSISDDLLEIFRTLFDARYPIGRMVLIDLYGADDEQSMRANNSSCFNFRFISGTNRLSKHSTGMAVDINPLYNPYVRVSNGRMIVEPAGADIYADRSADFPYKIERSDVCCQAFLKHGFEWGGDWTSRKDYQHFEKRSER